MTGRGFQGYGVVIAAAGILALSLMIVQRTGGALTYTLDDPYIHLAVAESILAGGYGINPGEYASPSSSILYPLLLAALLALGVGTLSPLALAGAASLWSAWLIAGIMRDNAISPGSSVSLWGAVLLLPVVFLALNVYALPLTGMEHSLHVLTVCFVVVGLTRLERGVPVPMILVAGIVLSPLVRFEGLAVSAAALLVLAWNRRIGALAGAIATLGAALVAYVAIMSSLGLPPLPSSVMVKSDISASAVDSGLSEAFVRMAESFRDALRREPGTLLALAMVAIWFGFAPRSGVPGRHIALALVALAGLAGHLVAGRYGWFSRYEVYANVLALLTIAILYRDSLRAAVAHEWARVVGLFGFLGVIAETYATDTIRVPAAGENIHAQQFQMHRFATEFFPYPVAVNDLGYVSYDNNTHVLDLWGLGSEEARRRRQAEDFGAEAVRELVGRHATSYAMIYDAWLGPAVPSDWCRIATLQTPKVSTASGEVAFYLIDRAREAEFREALNAWAGTLPHSARLTDEVATCPPAS